MHSIKVVKETANCLKALLSTPDGSSLLKKVEENSDSNLGTLEPFKIHKKKKVSTDIVGMTAILRTCYQMSLLYL